MSAAAVPVQYFQSVIAIEMAVAGALLWQIRYFESGSTAREDIRRSTDPRLRLALAGVIGATLFGSLWGIAHDAHAGAASAVTVGVAISVLPILLRVLPPLARDAATHERDSDYAVTVVGLSVYAAVITGLVALLNV